MTNEPAGPSTDCCMSRKVRVLEAGNIAILAITGSVDLDVRKALPDRVTQLIAQGANRIVIDLNEAAYVDSAALSALLGIRRRILDNGGQLAIAVDREHVLRIFSVTGLGSLFDIRPSVASAVEYLSGPSIPPDSRSTPEAPITKVP